MNHTENLKQAYQLIKAGKKEAAIELLRPICKADPNNADAWWLLANALTEPRQIYTALQRLLMIDPFHEQAQTKLDSLIAQYGTQPLVPAKLSTTSTITPKKKSSLPMMGGIAIILIIISLAAAFLLLQSSNDEPEIAAISTDVPLPTSVSSPTSIVTSTITLTATPRPSGTPLPATWTPTDPPTIDPNYVTNTPWLRPTTVLATADPALFGETYWDGIGDGYTLETYTRSGGRHLRFYEFPVKVFVSGGDEAWSSIVNQAIAQLSTVVPMERVASEPEATLVIFIMPPDEYERWSGCPQAETVGCAAILDMGDFGGGDTYHRILGDVYINTNVTNKLGAILHEMLHALGVMVHSPNENDIMFPYETQATRLSQRDLNTLRRLYANPSYAD